MLVADHVIDRRGLADAVGSLDDAQAFAVLHRMLWSEGYDDHIAGHITMRVGDDRLLATPYGLGWDEVRASDVITIGYDGVLIEGSWPVNPAIGLHVVAHRERPDAAVAVHHHPRFGVVWSALHRIPPVYDQLAGFEADDLTLYAEYEAGVDRLDIARRNVDAMQGSRQALLANHGVFVIGSSIKDVHQRCVVLEHRCRLAWHVEALGGGVPMQPAPAEALAGRITAKGGWPSFYEAMVARQLRLDPSVLD